MLGSRSDSGVLGRTKTCPTALFLVCSKVTKGSSCSDSGVLVGRGFWFSWYFVWITTQMVQAAHTLGGVPRKLGSALGLEMGKNDKSTENTETATVKAQNTTEQPR